MKLSLGSAILVITCLCLALAWYSEHSRFSAAQADWQNERAEFIEERSNLVIAASLLADRNAKLTRNDDEDDEPGWVGPDDDTPTDKELNQQYAAECLITAINIETDMLKAMRVHSRENSDISDEFKYVLNEYWNTAGKPALEKLERMAANSESKIVIKRPKALKKWITEFY